MTRIVKPHPSFSRWDVVLLGLWIGIIAGLVEGPVYLAVQAAGWMDVAQRFSPVDYNIIWASAIVTAGVIVLAACGLAAALRFVARGHWPAVASFVLASGGIYPILVVSGRIYKVSAVVLALGLSAAFSRWFARDWERRMAAIRRRIVPLAAAAILICVSVPVGERIVERRTLANLPGAPANAPNVLFIVLDTLRADRLGAYGYDRPTSPFLDRLASESVLFERAFANGPWTLPSHASMFTGRLPSEHGATLWYYDGRYPTLAEVLAEQGYATAGIVGNAQVCTRAFGLARGFQRWENIFVNAQLSALRTSYGREFSRSVLRDFDPASQSMRMHGDDITRRALGWIDQRPNRPFFMFLNYMDMHPPWSPPADLKLRVRGDRPPPANERELNNESYDASLAYLDGQVQALFDGIKARGLDDNLLVVVTADHGELMGEHGFYAHRNSVYLQALKVPLMIRFPRSAPAGQRVSTPVGTMQLPGTIMKLAGLSTTTFPAPTLDPLWTETAPRDAYVLSEVSGGDWPGVRENWPIRQGWIKSVIGSRWHYLLQQNGKEEIYEWQADPEEVRNLIASPDGSQAAGELRKALPR